MAEWLEQIPDGALRHKAIAAFDTRFDRKTHGFGLRLLMGAIGFAAPHIAATLRAKGGVPAAATEGFIINDTLGPLADGELERAAAWAHSISGALFAPTV